MNDPFTFDYRAEFPYSAMEGGCIVRSDVSGYQCWNRGADPGSIPILSGTASSPRKCIVFFTPFIVSRAALYEGLMISVNKNLGGSMVSFSALKAKFAVMNSDGDRYYVDLAGVTRLGMPTYLYKSAFTKSITFDVARSLWYSSGSADPFPGYLFPFVQPTFLVPGLYWIQCIIELQCEGTDTEIRLGFTSIEGNCRPTIFTPGTLLSAGFYSDVLETTAIASIVFKDLGNSATLLTHATTGKTLSYTSIDPGGGGTWYTTGVSGYGEIRTISPALVAARYV